MCACVCGGGRGGGGNEQHVVIGTDGLGDDSHSSILIS